MNVAVVVNTMPATDVGSATVSCGVSAVIVSCGSANTPVAGTNELTVSDAVHVKPAHDPFTTGCWPLTTFNVTAAPLRVGQGLANALLPTPVSTKPDW